MGVALASISVLAIFILYINAAYQGKLLHPLFSKIKNIFDRQ